MSRLRHSHSRPIHRLRLRRLPGRPASANGYAGLTHSSPRTSFNNPRPLHKPCPFTSDYRLVPDNSRFLAILFRIKEGGPGGIPLLVKSGTVEEPLEVVIT